MTPNVVSDDDVGKLIIPNDLLDEPSFKAYIEAKVYDNEGRLIQYHRQLMRSLTEYFLALMSIPIIGTFQSSTSTQASSILTNVLGLPSTQTSYDTNANISWNWAIQLGSGTQAFSVTLKNLAAPIANGTSSGQLNYGSLSVSYAGTSITVTLTVTNNSSSTISVTEIGLTGNVYIQYWNSSSNYASTTYSYLLSYDTFSTPISLPPSSVASFQITLTFTG